MNKKNKTIFTYIFAVALIGYILIVFNFFSGGVAMAFVDSMLQMQSQETDCTKNTLNCMKGQANSCSECLTHNNCNLDHLPSSLVKNSFTGDQKIFLKKNEDKIFYLGYPPESPPS
jgi:hypothetical protein